MCKNNKNVRVVKDLFDHIYLNSNKRIAMNIFKANPNILYSDEFLSKSISDKYFDVMFNFFRSAEKLKIIGRKEISFYFNSRSPKTGETILTSLVKRIISQHRTIRRLLELKGNPDIIEIEKDVFRENVLNLCNIYKYGEIYNINSNVCNYRQQYPIDIMKIVIGSDEKGFDFFECEYEKVNNIIASYDDKKERTLDKFNVEVIDVRKFEEVTLYVRDIIYKDEPITGVDDELLSKTKVRFISSDIPFYLLEDLEDEYSEAEIYPPSKYAYVSSVGTFFKKIVLDVSYDDNTIERFIEVKGKLVKVTDKEIMDSISKPVLKTVLRR